MILLYLWIVAFLYTPIPCSEKLSSEYDPLAVPAMFLRKHINCYLSHARITAGTFFVKAYLFCEWFFTYKPFSFDTYLKCFVLPIINLFHISMLSVRGQTLNCQLLTNCLDLVLMLSNNESNDFSKAITPSCNNFAQTALISIP